MLAKGYYAYSYQVYVLLLTVVIISTSIFIHHVCTKINKYGLANAFMKSVGRRGSWTASFYHFFAMRDDAYLTHEIKETKSIKLQLSEEEESAFLKRKRNIYGRYVTRTGERHDAEGKKKLRELRI